MSDDSYKFQKLTPFSDVELGVYKNAIDFVFANDDLKMLRYQGNIAQEKVVLSNPIRKVIRI
nr:hypothetical protein [Raoultella terrigena]